jgi:hypothetical protein
MASPTDGSLVAQIREVGPNSISGSLSADLTFASSSLSFAGDFEYDLTQQNFVSFRLITLKDGAALTAGIELTRVEPKPAPAPKPPEQAKPAPPAPPCPEPKKENEEPAAPAKPSMVVPVPGRPGWYYDPVEKKIIPPGVPVVPVNPANGKPSGPIVPPPPPNK